jgi:hypothetical protein
VTFSLAEVIAFVPLAQKIFSKILSEKDVIKFHVNPIRSRPADQKRGDQWYACGSPKAKVTIEGAVRISGLMDSGAEINVISFGFSYRSRYGFRRGM